MTPFEIERIPFTKQSVTAWSALDRRHTDWPVVYVLDGKGAAAISDVYVGESRNATARMRQHLESDDKKNLSTLRVVLDERFNKSVCLDLESFLIRMLAGDGSYRVLNRNDGITEGDYFDRELYRDTFREVFDRLKNDGVFTRSIPEIENSDLFKLSPFKALTSDQGAAVESILEGLFTDLENETRSTTVVQGEPGTGKTVVAIYLLKLIADIAASKQSDDIDSDSMFSEFFVGGYAQLVTGLRIGLVVPQQSLRNSIKKVFKKTPGLSPDMVMTAFDVGASEDDFDLLIVDESHRLNQRANQASGVQNKKFIDITTALFGFDDKSKTQLDWLRAKSRHQILLLDAAQTVRPADLPRGVLEDLVVTAKSHHRHYPLISQMRVKAGSDYVSYIRGMLGPAGRMPSIDFGEYDFRMFDSVASMRQEIRMRDAAVGLSRMVAGYAWPWISRNDKNAFDISIDGEQFRWNSTQSDWIASAASAEEVGSIHTVQGYDLNYAGVIIGPDLRFEPGVGIVVDRASYYDAKGKENNSVTGTKYSDADLLRFITNIYAVLLTRGIRGTYVYVCDPGLREYLRPYFTPPLSLVE
jgi:DUF2075 family protein